ncbi:MAG: penicillin acylase family protein, partial [bacterium]
MAKFFSGEGLHDTMVYHQMKDGTRRDARAARGGREPAGARGGRGRMMEMPEPLPPDDDAAVVQREDVSEEWIQQVEAFAKQHQLGGEAAKTPGEEGPKFSHAWVVGGEKTNTGSAVLCSDPQTPVRNPSLFYEFHISGKTFDARGIGVPGSPVILIGFSKHAAWGMTALGADQADQFMLKTDPDHPDQYQFDGEWRDMTVWTETIQSKRGEAQTITLKETHLGPVVSAIAHDVRRGEEVVLKRIPQCETDRDTIQGAVAMMRAKDVYEFSTALEGWRFPSANVVFGDTQGNIGYWTLAAIPIRSPFALDRGNATHDGSESKYDWQGIIPYNLLPHTINPKRGYLHSANHRPIASFYPAENLGISTGSAGDTVRSWRLHERLEMKESFTPEDVFDIHYDCVNPAKREMVRMGYHLRDELKADLSEEALQALKYLEEWFAKGAKSDLNIQGTELVNQISTMFRMVNSDLALTYGGGNSGLSRFLKSVQSRIEKDPHTAISDEEKAYIDTVLANAWEDAFRSYGRNPDEWNARARRQVQQRKLGYFESLDGFPSVDRENDLTYPGIICTDNQTIFSQGGESYSQWVPMHDVDSAKTLLPVGESENPKSPFHAVMREDWAKGELHPAPLSRGAVEKFVVKS